MTSHGGLIADGRKRPFVVIEGADGAGTTTQAEALRLRINAAGIVGVRAVATRLPTESEIGRLLRTMLRGERPTWGWQVQMHLFCADRYLHVAEVVDPALGIGPSAWVQPSGVILDRYGYSTAVYQGLQAAAQTDRMGVGHEDWSGRSAASWAKVLLRQMQGDPGWREPDLAVLLDVDPIRAEQRRAARAGAVEVFDGMSFQRAVVQGYRDLWEQAARWATGARYVVVDGNQPVEAVTEQIQVAAWRLFAGCAPCTVKF